MNQLRSSPTYTENSTSDQRSAPTRPNRPLTQASLTRNQDGTRGRVGGRSNRADVADFPVALAASWQACVLNQAVGQRLWAAAGAPQ